MFKKVSLLAIIILIVVGCSTKKDVMNGYDNLYGKDHNFVYKEYNVLLNDMISREKGIYFIGSSDSYWSKSLAPILNEELGIFDVKSYYIAINSSEFDKDTQSLYLDFDKTLSERDRSYGSIPFVVFVDKEGDIKTFSGTVFGHEEGQVLSDVDKQEIINELDKLIKFSESKEQ